ncbi:probable alpha-amylase 2 [Dioscorea cayenensis subsp. rotundata]|uniref:1,4-alpha-D-glucan glucanohydrolase n=1 Tax=Dioscorea cayennensis subsp. rotundata TaxID=55577 RepID=A0AB40CG70_DIOCR|nr:probable alpha-amylase 2 [Dioscorea cayenensis subsp. rotundata]
MGYPKDTLILDINTGYRQLKEVDMEHGALKDFFRFGNKSTGENFEGFPNIDHTQNHVRRDIIGWLTWLRNTIGFQDFRFDFAKGYDAKYVKEYVEESKPLFSIGEYWVDCSYSSGLDHNQDSHRQGIINWINGTGGLCAAFDFTTKSVLQEAIKGQFWRLRDSDGKPPGVMGWWPSRAVTFIENHDTGSTQKVGTLEDHLTSYPDDIKALRSLLELKVKTNLLPDAIAIIDCLIALEPEDKDLPLLGLYSLLL